MRRTFLSTLIAACLTLGTAGAINVASGLVAPTTAHASVLGKVKGAVKGVGSVVKVAGGSVKTAAKGVGAVAKSAGTTVGKGAVIGGKAVGKAAVVSGKAVGRVAVDTAHNAADLGKAIAKSPVGKAVEDAGRQVGRGFKQTYDRLKPQS
jgi:hypothetical protein